MEKLLFVNVLMRDNSRTKILANYALDKLKTKYEIEEINLTNAKIEPLNHDTILSRINEGEKDHIILKYANSFKEADRILIAAPFWDMSFPSILRVFFERISLDGITFKTDEFGVTTGNCNASKLLYITSRGLNISDRSANDCGYHYLNAISKFFGIKILKQVSMNRIDLKDTNVDEEIQKAKDKLDIVLKNF